MVKSRKRRAKQREKEGEKEKRTFYTHSRTHATRGTIHETADGLVRVPGARRCVRVSGCVGVTGWPPV